MERKVKSEFTADLMPDLGDVTMDERIEILLANYARKAFDWKAYGLNLLHCLELEPGHPRGPVVVRRVLADYEREIGRTHPMTLEARRVLAGVLAAWGEDAEAERVYRSALGLAGKEGEQSGEESDATKRLRDSLFLFLARRDRLGEARKLRRKPPAARAVHEQGRLAQLLEEADRPQEAIAEYRGALAAAETVLGRDHQLTMNLRTLLAMLATRVGHPVAEEAQRGVVDDLDRNEGPDSRPALVARSNLASLVLRLGRLDEAEALFRDVVEDHRRVLGAEHPGTIITAANYANLLYDLDRDRAAQRLFRELLPVATRTLGPDHPVTRAARNAAARATHPAPDDRDDPAPRAPGGTEPDDASKS